MIQMILQVVEKMARVMQMVMQQEKAVIQKRTLIMKLMEMVEEKVQFLKKTNQI
jgi:hypothetical protein